MSKLRFHLRHLFLLVFIAGCLAWALRERALRQAIETRAYHARINVEGDWSLEIVPERTSLEFDRELQTNVLTVTAKYHVPRHAARSPYSRPKAVLMVMRPRDDAWVRYDPAAEGALEKESGTVTLKASGLTDSNAWYVYLGQSGRKITEVQTAAGPGDSNR
jgi:hypothetical protein